MVSRGSSFLICVPQASAIRVRERFRTIGRAVVRIAEIMDADIEVSQKMNLLSVWVYYKNGGEKWSPVYFDWGKHWSEDEVFASIRREVYHSSKQEHIILQSAWVRKDGGVMCCLKEFTAMDVKQSCTKELRWSHRLKFWSFMTANARSATENSLQLPWELKSKCMHDISWQTCRPKRIAFYFYFPVSTSCRSVSQRVLKSCKWDSSGTYPSRYLLLGCGRPYNFNGSPASAKEGISMAQCFDCCNLVRSWKPTVKTDWLFEETWKCEVTDEQLVEYYLIHAERECKHYEKRPKLVLGSIG